MTRTRTVAACLSDAWQPWQPAPDLSAAMRDFIAAQTRLDDHSTATDYAISDLGDHLQAMADDARALLNSAAKHHGVDLGKLARAL